MTGHSISFGSVHKALVKRFSPVQVVKRADSCTQQSFYKKPAAGAVVSMNEALDIQWNNQCIGQPATVDVTLISTSLSTNASLIAKFLSVDFSAGEYSAKIDPSLFQNAANLTYQLSIVAAGSTDTPSIYQTTPPLPLGPLFTGSFNKTQASINPLAGTSTDRVTTAPTTPPKGLSKGSIAAAVIMPILVVACGIAAYVWWSRKKEATRRREYRENLDQRMSIAPGADWAPISAAGAAAAIRHSMAISTQGGGDRNTRASSFFGRQSTYTQDPPQEMRQTSRARNTSTEQSRTSRVSFAETAHSRGGDRPAVPPLPQAYRKSAYSGGDQDTNGDALSPTQREGAFALDEDSIRDRLSGTSGNNRNSGEFDHDADTLPALTMMRANEGSPTLQQPAPVLTRESTAGDYRTYSIGAYSGNTDSIITDSNSNAPSYFNPPSNSADPDEALRHYATRNPQMLPVTTTASPFSGFAAGPGLAAAAGFDMSPDAIFRAYAATRPAAPPAAADLATPGVMRNLYNPTMTQGLGLRPRADTVTSNVGNNNTYRESLAPGQEDYDVGKAH